MTQELREAVERVERVANGAPLQKVYVSDAPQAYTFLYRQDLRLILSALADPRAAYLGQVRAGLLASGELGGTFHGEMVGTGEADDGPSVLAVLMEDYLARGQSEADHAILLKHWILAGAEHMARAAGRQYTMDSVEHVRRFIRDARPGNPWKP